MDVYVSIIVIIIDFIACSSQIIINITKVNHNIFYAENISV